MTTSTSARDILAQMSPGDQRIHMVPFQMLTPRHLKDDDFDSDKRRAVRATIEYLRDQKQGIGKTGILQPMEVSFDRSASKLLVNTGMLTYSALRDLNWPRRALVPVVVADAKEEEAYRHWLLDVIHSPDSQPISRAGALHAWMNFQSPPMTLAAAAEQLGRKRWWIQMSLAPVNLSEDLAAILPPDGSRADLLRRIEPVAEPRLRAALKEMFVAGQSRDEILSAVNRYAKTKRATIAGRANPDKSLREATRHAQDAAHALKFITAPLSSERKKAIRAQLKELQRAADQCREQL